MATFDHQDRSPFLPTVSKPASRGWPLNCFALAYTFAINIENSLRAAL